MASVYHNSGPASFIWRVPRIKDIGILIKSKLCRKRSKFPMQFCSGLLCNIPSILRLSSPDIGRAKKHSAYLTCVPFLHTLILKNEEQPSEKKIQSNLSQVIKQSPHAKI